MPMHLFINTTSPFVRLVRIALAEKGLADRVETEVVDPWADSDQFLGANPAGRIPVLATEDGAVIAESTLILRYLDSVAPAPAVFPEADLARTLAQAAPILGAIDASTAILIGRRSNPGFDTHIVGERRFRTVATVLDRLEAEPPRDMAERVDIANIAAVTLIDYVLLRFPERGWLDARPTLGAWRERHRDRPSLVSTQPYV